MSHNDWFWFSHQLQLHLNHVVYKRVYLSINTLFCYLSEKRAPAQRNPIQRKKVYFFETKLLEADSSNPLCCLSKTMISYRERISKSDCGTNRTRPKTKSSHVFNYFNRFHGQSRVTETLKQRFIRVSVWIHTILLHF